MRISPHSSRVTLLIEIRILEICIVLHLLVGGAHPPVPRDNNAHLQVVECNVLEVLRLTAPRLADLMNVLVVLEINYLLLMIYVHSMENTDGNVLDTALIDLEIRFIVVNVHQVVNKNAEDIDEFIHSQK